MASGALSKKLNEKLKASQAQDSDYDSFKSASEGDVELPELGRSGGKKKFEKEKEREGKRGYVRGKGIGVVDYLPTTELHWQEVRGKWFREAVKGLVNQSSQRDEHGSSTEETLADLLKKASSPTTTETPLPKGRATRSRVKQSESDLQKALAKSKKKRIDKGKGKVAESSEAVEVEKMEQVHQEDHTTMEVQTPKPKKTKTSSKKSSSVSKTVEPSLAKRTRSVVKNKQVRISEDEEWSGEEESESDGEQDKLAKFGKRKNLKGRLLKDLMEPEWFGWLTP
ncbi:uncharacterized protein [Nicotiana sylvestris]|uniref:uncharacterized protein n=1 Tax=Nicotiana sylvestris TaxID=4096 RepID=UPI00388CE1FB